jgi:hypothetical protein
VPTSNAATRYRTGFGNWSAQRIGRRDLDQHLLPSEPPRIPHVLRRDVLELRPDHRGHRPGQLRPATVWVPDYRERSRGERRCDGAGSVRWLQRHDGGHEQVSQRGRLRLTRQQLPGVGLRALVLFLTVLTWATVALAFVVAVRFAWLVGETLWGRL